MPPSTSDWRSDCRKGSQPFTVQEWGTFTSVAGVNGRAVEWAPLYGPGDPPCFVETPVLYFYAQSPLTASVRVGFPAGWITEWFPKATLVLPAAAEARDPGAGRIEWSKVEIFPGAPDVKLPGTSGSSHYYAARKTDAAPVRIGGQWGKLIFYRGIGNFQPPVEPTFDAGRRLHVKSAAPVPVVYWFENHGGQIRYRTVGSGAMEAPEPGSLPALVTDLTGYLVESGLYRREAEAMLETWRDSWFEPGSRLIYIMPRRRVDELLPLEIAPAPSSVARVFVGRSELLAPWVREAMRTGGSKQFGRFATAFYAEMLRSGDRSQPARFEARGPACVE